MPTLPPLSRFAPILVLGLALVSPAGAQERAAPPSLTTLDARAAPWTSVGRMNNSAYGRCAAVLLGPRVAVTAAHCLFNRRSGRFLEAGSIHVLFGFDRGSYGFHATVAAIEIAEGYDPKAPARTLPMDFAVLRLAQAVPKAFAPARPAEDLPDPGRPLAAAGYAQERSEVLSSAPPCSRQGTDPAGLIVSDCYASHGFSGGPLFDAETGNLVGMTVASALADGRPVALAVPAARLVEALAP